MATPAVAPALLLVALLPVAAAMPALVALAVLAVVTVTGVILGNVHARPQRQAIRDIRLAEQQSLESTETDWRRRQD
ncbi:hypothetical protein O7632_00950 [Solwaraspora sp. WMMD406]|uniref:hypothetical protein n=1 Tax=Solwaraspora sp. WMMD406 TaxID=3016095 RepID=UPI00241733B7|nr:hypothetical protein [Solwaraspora sp. WMMD406]MDG4762690.1 hypothetical protein [Solwaraspora sp. WMMD406]